MILPAIFYEEKQFIKLWLAQVLSQLALNTFNFILAIAIYDSTKSNQSVSFVVISFGLAAFLFGIAAGIIVDHFDLKNVLFITTIARFFVVLAFLLFTGSFWGTLIVAFSLNAVSQFFFPAESASIPSIVSKENLLFANSLYTMSYYVAQVIGYLSAGELVGFFGYKISIVAISGLFLLSAFFILMVNIPKRASVQVMMIERLHRKVIAGFKDCLIYIKRNREIQRALIYLGGSQVIVGMFVSLLPGYAVEVLGVGVHKTGFYLLGPSIIGMVIAGLFLGSLDKHKSHEVLLKASTLGAFISVFFLSINFEKLGLNPILMAGISMFVVGLFNSMIVIIANTNLQSHTTENMRGRIYGVLQTIATVFAAVPVLLAGYLADTLGVNLVLIMVGAFIFLIGIFANSRVAKLV